LKQEVTSLIEDGCASLIVNLDDVTYLDSTGLGVLLSALRRVIGRGGDLGIVCDREMILRLFQITNLDQVFTLHRDEDTARARLSPESHPAS